jgi:hypothetical protein
VPFCEFCDPLQQSDDQAGFIGPKSARKSLPPAVKGPKIGGTGVAALTDRSGSLKQIKPE